MAASLRGLAFWGTKFASSNAVTGSIIRSRVAAGVSLRHDRSIQVHTRLAIPRAVYGGRHTVTMIPGDGSGNELMTHVREVFRYADVPVDFEEVKISKASEEDDTVDHALLAVKRNGVCLKGNIETDTLGFGQQSKNVSLRTQLDLFANIVHCQSVPSIKTRHNDVDLVIIRENTEGEYSNLEHENVPGVVESLKIITDQKSTRIAKFAFDFAVKHGRKKVTAIHKANIMKLGDGLFLECCRRVSELYPNIEFDSMIIDNASMQMVSRPQQFDVMVMPNLYGNILSNIGAGLVGGPGIIAGSNIGENHAIFEMGTRGSYKAKPNTSNPSAMLLASCAMLDYIGLHPYANSIRDSVFKILGDSKNHTEDLGGRASTIEVVEAIIRDIRGKAPSPGQ